MKAPENSKKPPSVIYLQAYGDDMTDEEISESDFSEILLGYDSVSWCVSKQYDTDIEYTRSDLCMVWQPIETAPEDIGDIMVWQPSTNECFIAFLNELGKWQYGICGTTYICLKDAPTHWMPLPKPPEGL